ncbi:MAG: hypothetical protein N2653_09360 [Burkholderiales bacterium]|nr:hypothetical protein [Burkholderiales bacterium]
MSSLAGDRESAAAARRPAVLERAQFSRLLAALAARGYRVLGPTVREGAIAYDEIAADSDLPAGWTDEQAPGRYRLRRRADAALFAYAVGPHSWKRFLHPPRERLWRLRKNGDRIEAIAEPESARRDAFLGVRACELAAIGILDRVLAEGELADARYRARRNEAFIVAVNCAVAASTCFCASLGTGPRVRSGYALALTELLDERGHVFLVEAGSERGAELLLSLIHI